MSKYDNKPLTEEQIKKLLELKNEDERKKEFPNHSSYFLKKTVRDTRKKFNIISSSVKQNPPLTREQEELLLRTNINEEYSSVFPKHSRDFLRKKKKQIRQKYGLGKDNKPIETTIQQDLLVKDKDEIINRITNKNKELIKEIELLRAESDIKKNLKENFIPDTIDIRTQSKSVTSAIVLQCSDWHIEETVYASQVSGLNEFNLDIASKRVNQFANDSKDVIDTIVLPYNTQTLILAIQGDFISGTIHDELMEGNSLLPGDAILKAQNMLCGFIDFFIENTTIPKIMIVPSSGNHGRMTKKQRISTELGNSLEHYMYNIIADKYEENDRIDFIRQEGYHTNVNVYGTKVRFHHGHFIRYGGGVGGITIPVNKAISQWNKTKNVDLDVFGHFHQTLNHKSFVCNGSLIGYNAYAVNIKAEYEPPSQNLFVIDSKRGKTLFTPIILD